MAKENEQLATHTTLQVGGPAEYFTTVTTEEELVEACRYAHERSVPVKILGGGSNVLVPDAGVSGLVIQNHITGFESDIVGDTVTLTVGAGEVFDEVVAQTVRSGWWGLENLSHIPGLVGATPVQNVGAYGVEVKDLIKRVRVFDRTREQFAELAPEDCQFAYRDSIFKRPAGATLVITAVTFTLSTQPRPQLTYRDLQERFADATPSVPEIREAVIAIRAKKFPDWHRVGTAGSFFKNPVVSSEQFAKLQAEYPELPGFATDRGVKVPLGWILDKVLQYKGVREGAVGTYQGQALVIVNHGGATATEITEFAKQIANDVKASIGIEIEWEVTRW